jgi:hypothetical protein
MAKTLFIRPSHDDVTSYLYHYSKGLVEDSRRRGFTTFNKEKESAAKGIVIPLIDKNDPSFIMFNGHGSPDLICGHNNEIIIQNGLNNVLLKNRLVYSLSCSSAAGIGFAVADENTAFIGYLDEFALGMDVNCQASVSHDQRAKLFLDPSNLLVKSLLKGNSAKEAVSKAKEQMKKNISLLRTDPFPDAKDYIPYLYNNYVVLDVLGNKEKKV